MTDTHTFLETQTKGRQKPGLRLIIIGAVIAILGALVIPAILLFTVFSPNSDDNKFATPGSYSTEITKPGRYFLWNHSRTIFKGTMYYDSKTLTDDVSIVISDHTGKLIPFVTDRSFSVSNNGDKRSSIGYIEINETNTIPTKLLIKVDSNKLRIFSLSEFSLSHTLGLAIGVIGVLFAIVLIGVGFIIAGTKKVATTIGSSTNSTP